VASPARRRGRDWGREGERKGGRGGVMRQSRRGGCTVACVDPIDEEENKGWGEEEERQEGGRDATEGPGLCSFT